MCWYSRVSVGPSDVRRRLSALQQFVEMVDNLLEYFLGELGIPLETFVERCSASGRPARFPSIDPLNCAALCPEHG